MLLGCSQSYFLKSNDCAHSQSVLQLFFVLFRIKNVNQFHEKIPMFYLHWQSHSCLSPVKVGWLGICRACVQSEDSCLQMAWVVGMNLSIGSESLFLELCRDWQCYFRHAQASHSQEVRKMRCSSIPHWSLNHPKEAAAWIHWYINFLVTFYCFRLLIKPGVD